MIKVQIQKKKFNPQKILKNAEKDKKYGALVSFIGSVREETNNGKIKIVGQDVKNYPIYFDGFRIFLVLFFFFPLLLFGFFLVRREDPASELQNHGE